MRKIFLISMFTFCISYCFAQLPNGLMGVEVGFTKAQVDSVIATFQKVKVKVDQYGTIEVSGKLYFDDIKWNILRIRTYGGEVKEVQLEKSNKMSSFSNEANGLMDKYKNRYAKYYEDWTTKQNYCFESMLKFNDKSTRELHITYYLCPNASLYLTCSQYSNYQK